jgi:hypothetical protein
VGREGTHTKKERKKKKKNEKKRNRIPNINTPHTRPPTEHAPAVLRELSLEMRWGS